jgi:hypothetical protein
LSAAIEVTNAEIAPHHGRGGIQPRGAFPESNGFFVTAPIIEQVAR